MHRNADAVEAEHLNLVGDPPVPLELVDYAVPRSAIHLSVHRVPGAELLGQAAPLTDVVLAPYSTLPLD